VFLKKSVEEMGTMIYKAISKNHIYFSISGYDPMGVKLIKWLEYVLKFFIAQSVICENYLRNIIEHNEFEAAGFDDHEKDIDYGIGFANFTLISIIMLPQLISGIAKYFNKKEKCRKL
jgi:hypothetical protein